jgi:hypothetical protein
MHTGEPAGLLGGDHRVQSLDFSGYQPYVYYMLCVSVKEAGMSITTTSLGHKTHSHAHR